jgi:hypothetical protein
MFEINKHQHSLDIDIEDMILREYKGYLPQTTEENVLSESMFDDQLLLSSIRKTKKEPLFNPLQNQYVFDFIGSDAQLKDAMAELEAIELTLREILISLPKEIRVKTYQLALEGRYQYEKIVSRPALITALLLNTDGLTEVALEDLRLPLSGSDIHVLAMLGLPQSLTQAFKRIVPSSLNKEIVYKLKQSIKLNPHIAKRLSFIKRINTGVLTIVCDTEVEKVVTDRLLNEVGFEQSEDREAKLIILIRKMLNLREELQRFDSIKQVKRAYERSIRKAKTGVANGRIKFRPQLTGNEIITPLNDAKAIRAIGEHYENCLGSEKLKEYLRSIALNQNIYIYRIDLTKIFEALFSIKRNEKGLWSIDEFEFHNPHTTELIYEELTVVINHWLAEKQNVDVSDIVEEGNGLMLT